MPHQRFPKVKILHLSTHEVKFILSETDISMANTFRRIMIAEVPTLAIDLVEFYENSTVLNDEYIAHRLGLIPIKYCPPESLKSGIDCNGAFLSHRECVCYERCPRCSVEFDLDIEFDNVIQTRNNKKKQQTKKNLFGGLDGDKMNDDDDDDDNENDDDEDDLNEDDDVLAPLTVTSVDLKSNNEFVSPAHFLQNEQDESQDEGIAIVKMGSGQKLKLKAVARLGISKEHAKWCPVAVVTYRFWPIISINHEAIQKAGLTLEEKQQLVDSCSDRILQLDPISGMISESEDAWDTATYTEDLKFCNTALKKRPEDDDFVTVTHSKDRFIFSLESTGCMDADEILMSALRVLKDRLNYLATEVENLKETG